MRIRQATRKYEAWLGRNTRIVQLDLAAKHQRMREDPFSFLRATYYRWAQLFPKLCPELAGAPAVLCVGDLHVENYGTWRDAEGRLVWGINDFDEAFPLPFTNDLVRLAASALLACRLHHLSLGVANGCAAILEGYTGGLADGGEPFVLSEQNQWLRATVTSRLRDPVRFWQKLAGLPTVKRVPAEVMRLLKQAMPERDLDFRVAHRRAGVGSLGRPRFTALADWRGGKIAREVKALLPSACVWASASSRPASYYSQILAGAVRAPDPFLAVRGRWVRRRLSPYCNRIELAQLPRGGDAEKLLQAMGRELGNIHLGSRRNVPAVRRELHRRRAKWLHHAAGLMLEATLKDWKEWRKEFR